MERETKKIVLEKSRKEIEVKTYITSREKRAIDAIFLGGQSISIGTDGQNNVQMNAILVQQAQEKALELLTVSFDGSSELIVDRILDLPAEHADEIFAIIDGIKGSIPDEKKD